MQQPVSQIASAPDNADCKSDQNLNSLFVNEEICYRKESIFILRCKHVYFYYKVRVFFGFFCFLTWRCGHWLAVSLLQPQGYSSVLKRAESQ